MLDQRLRPHNFDIAGLCVASQRRCGFHHSFLSGGQRVRARLFQVGLLGATVGLELRDRLCVVALSLGR